jgi:hypothetical protein
MCKQKHKDRLEENNCSRHFCRENLRDRKSLRSTKLSGIEALWLLQVAKRWCRVRAVLFDQVGSKLLLIRFVSVVRPLPRSSTTLSRTQGGTQVIARGVT